VPIKPVKKKSTRSLSDQMLACDQESQDSISSASSDKNKPKQKKAAKKELEELPAFEQDKENEPSAVVEAMSEVALAKPKKRGIKRKASTDEDSDAVPEAAAAAAVESDESQTKAYPLCDHDYAAPPGAPIRRSSVPQLAESSSDYESVSSVEAAPQSVGIRHYDSTGAPMVSSEITYCEQEEMLKSKSVHFHHSKHWIMVSYKTLARRSHGAIARKACCERLFITFIKQ
jgi:hypothetical protein